MTNTWLDLFLEILFLFKLFKFIISIYFSVYSFDDTYTLCPLADFEFTCPRSPKGS